ncbi:MAG: amino acid permease [candidate division KSB1 bacterium]|nr:amino acid permease [candidate division KSB1 bacterium]MDZ7304369.1 amino acid permease [candidate division KSB1 bacterium]MDZ7313518.1 amino acid permease [candidate division KSB1 bacterium]
MPQLQQKLTLFDMTMIAIGSTIGSGIFLTPSSIAKALPSPFWILLVWVLGGLMALSGALTFAELGARMPGVGGVYVYLREAYGGLVGFLYGWAYFLVVNTGGIAALSVAFATYFGYFVPLTPAGIKIAAIIGLIIVTVINVLGVKAGGVFSDIFTVLKLVGIAGLIVVGLGWGTSATADFTFALGDLSNGLGSALAVAMVGVLWSYGGWQHATFLAAEAKDARRTIPLAMILGAFAVTLIYLLTNVAYMFLLSPQQIGNSSRVAAEAVGVILGPIGASLIALAIFISTFGTTGIYTLTAPRIYYAMANDGVFFNKVAEVHPRFHTPALAILFQSVWAVVLILFWGTFENLISYVVFTDWIFFALAAASVFIFRQRAIAGSYKTFGYPLTPLFFVATSIWFIVNTLIEKPAQAWAGLGFLAFGVPVYYFWKTQRRRL